MDMRPMLYHFTCEHGYEGISKTGIVVPRIHPFMRHLGPLLWLTDLEAPTADAVGLTSERLTCNRLHYSYRVRTRAAVQWSEVRGRVSPALVVALEAYGEPSHWRVVRRSLTPSEFALDEVYQAPQPHSIVEER